MRAYNGMNGIGRGICHYKPRLYILECTIDSDYVSLIPPEY
jgi:hypothetical protein